MVRESNSLDRVKREKEREGGLKLVFMFLLFFGCFSRDSCGVGGFLVSGEAVCTWQCVFVTSRPIGVIIPHLLNYLVTLSS